MVETFAILGIVSVGYFKMRGERKYNWLITQLLNCPLCLGFWASIFIYFNPVEFVNFAFANCFICFLIVKIINGITRRKGTI